MAGNDISEIREALTYYMEIENMSGITEVLNESDNVSLRSRAAEFEDLCQQALICKRCGLHKTRNNVVFGAGNTNAALVFVGEAPGMEEDLQGLPFVGRAGKLLTKIIEAMGLKRQQVYIANILKCRPPNNRNPLPTEIITCEDYLIRQIELISPKVICALGKFAAQTLLRVETPISRLRGKFFDYHGIKLMPTYHPAYLLRNPQDKRLVWEDMKKIMKIIRQR